MKLLIGTDEGLRRRARAELGLQVDAIHVEDSLSFSRERVLQLLMGQALFGERYGVILDRTLEDAAVQKAVLEILRELNPDTPLLMFESSCDQELRKTCAQLGVVVVEGGATEAPRFSPFAFTERVAARDKKGAWIKWHEAMAEGEDPHYVHAMLAWQLRVMLLASRFEQHETDLKPFTYTKAKRAARNFTTKELEALSRQAIELHARSRTTEGGEFSFLIERFLLGL